MDFVKLFQETGPASPIIFILSPGVDPLKDVESLGTFKNEASCILMFIYKVPLQEFETL